MSTPEGRRTSLIGRVCIGVIGVAGEAIRAARPGRFCGEGGVDIFAEVSVEIAGTKDASRFLVDLARLSMKTVEPVVRDIWNLRTGNGSVGRTS